MNINLVKQSLLIACSFLIVTACSTAKIEARLEANPQCKDVINPKTGALMPCPGSDKAFYKEVGLTPAKTSPTEINSPRTSSAEITPAKTSPAEITPAVAAPLSPTPTPNPLPVECKPQIHKKTGGTLPCPAAD